jgi:hypothetical protein
MIILINSSRCTVIVYDMFMKLFLVPEQCLGQGTGVFELTGQPPPARVPLGLGVCPAFHVNGRRNRSSGSSQVGIRYTGDDPVPAGFRCATSAADSPSRAQEFSSSPLQAHSMAVAGLFHCSCAATSFPNFQRPCENDRAGCL